jgi:hypothetical protein
MTETWFGILNFGHCDLFVIWNLVLGIFCIQGLKYYQVARSIFILIL